MSMDKNMGEGSSVLTPDPEATHTPSNDAPPAKAEPAKAEIVDGDAPKLARRAAKSKEGTEKPARSPKGDAAKLQKAAAAGAKNVSKREQRRIKSYAQGLRRELTPREARTMAIVYAVSIALHLVVLLALGYFTFKAEIDDALSAITSKIEEPPEEKEEPIEVVETDEPVEELLEDDAPPEEETITEHLEPDEAPIDLNPAEPEEMAAPPVEDIPDAPDPSAKIPEGDLAGRASAESREAMRDKFGGNAETDAAVFAGLRWLETQQVKGDGPNEGAWFFDKVKGGKAGSLKECGTGATGMVLLAYLGAGQTHLAGDYKQTVFKGLLYLMKQVDVNNNAADLRSGDANHAKMYAHCIATLALCEAYAMTKGQLRDGLPGEDDDGKRKTTAERNEERRKLALLRQFEDKLRTSAQLAVNFLVQAQDKTGGWRYEPRKGGDTSVTGWAVMALHSAFVAGLQVPTNSIRGANLYLTRVQVDGGAQFGYTKNEPNRPGTSAAGLLCRIYLQRNHPGIPKGIQYLSSVGPSLNNMYFNYYATQVLHHWGGAEWEKWNLKNRAQLVAAQRKDGAAKGSWPAAGGHAGIGGDILQTCFCVMTLEVYYRHLPIYQRQKQQTDI